jgi:streptogramin lyase
VSGSRIFISYRHTDSAGYAGRLYDRLQQRYGDQQVFMDLEMEYGIDFVERIDTAVESSAVMLVMIGAGWLTVRNEADERRIDDPEDFVRIEVSSALARPTRVIPVLVGNAKMPGSDDLPPPMKPLARRNALELSDSRWDYDVGRLIETLDASGVVAAAPDATAGPRPESGRDPPPPEHPTRRRRTVAIAAAVCVAAIAVIGTVVALSSGSSNDGGPDHSLGLGKTAKPSAIAVDPSGKALWVAETGTHKLAQIAVPGLKLMHESDLPADAEPRRVVVDGHGIVWLSDPKQHRLLRVDPRAGTAPATPVAVDGVPRGLAIDRATGNLLVADSLNQRVIMLTPTGRQLDAWPVPAAKGLPRSLVLGESGIVWVSDSRDQRVLRLDTSTRQSIPVSIPGTPGELARDPTASTIWVTNSTGGDVVRLHRDPSQAVTPDAFGPKPVAVGDSPIALAIAGDVIWVANVGDGSVARLSHRRPYHKLGANIPVGGTLAGIAARGTQAWVTDSSSGVVTELDAR